MNNPMVVVQLPEETAWTVYMVLRSIEREMSTDPMSCISTLSDIKMTTRTFFSSLKQLTIKQLKEESVSNERTDN